MSRWVIELFAPACPRLWFCGFTTVLGGNRSPSFTKVIEEAKEFGVESDARATVRVLELERLDGTFAVTPFEASPKAPKKSSMTGDLIRVEDQLDVYFDALKEATNDEEKTQLELVLTSAVVEHATRVDSIVNWFARSEAEVEYLERREMELREQIERHVAKQSKVRAILADHMDMTGQKKLPGRETKGITFVSGAMRVEILDSSAIPEQFKKVKVIETVTVDKRAIKAALDSFEDVPGAALVQGTPTVRVK